MNRKFEKNFNAPLRRVNTTLLETLGKRVDKINQMRQEELLRYNNLATIGELSAGLTHEIITPLTNIKMNLSVIRNKSELNNEIKTALAGVDQINSLVSSYLQQVRYEKCHKCFNPFSEIKLAETLLAYKIRKSGVRLIHDFPDNLRIQGNPTKFTQVMINLISNALDAYPDVQITTRVSLSDLGNQFKIVEISAKLINRDKDLRIRVLDMGIGIPNRNKNRIFQTFFTTKKEKGTGLGLSISRQIIEQNFKGSLELISNKNPTIFEIKVPTAK